MLHNKENSGSSDAAPPSKRKKLSLAKLVKDCFSDTVSNEELKMSQGFVPENIAKNTKWAINVFSSWLESRNHRTGESTPMDYLDGPFSTEVSKVELTRILSLFLV